jgi:dihydropteroate synthase
MISVKSICFDTLDETATEFERFGFSAGQAKKAAMDTMCLHLKFEGIPTPIIRRLHELTESLKIRLVRARWVTESAETENLLLSATPGHMEELARLTESGSPDLHDFSQKLRNHLRSITKTRFTIRCRTQTLVVGEKTLVMGTINVTPDSFSDGGLYLQPEKAIDQALEMVEHGADIIDVGGESTRPGSRGVDAEEEIGRIMPVITAVSAQTDTPLSVDTRKARVAREALEAGCQIVNDVTALRSDPQMGHVVAHYGAAIVLMHMRGTPETMQRDIHYVSLMSEIIQYLEESIHLAHSAGIDTEKIIVDPGIGFGKTVDHNLVIIKRLYELRSLGRPILIGTSRKSFIGRILNADITEREEGSLASVVASILNGAHIVRVHNVRNAVRAARLADAVKTVSLPEA